MQRIIEKSSGVTVTERMLTCLCDSTFLKLWSYANPFNENGNELCDILAVFENHIFIFFDREKLRLDDKDNDLDVTWKRWKKKVIEAQIKTARGAERYVKSGRKIFLDQENKIEFPISFNPSGAKIHKIIVAHGAANACKEFSEDNVSGSLAISYGTMPDDIPLPFFISLDKLDPIHVFDSENLEILLGELDTFHDFSAYLLEKERAITKYATLAYCGEEDLLAHYLYNFDSKTNKHFIGAKDKKINGVYIAEGEWQAFSNSELYKNRKKADEQSYFWDELIQRTCNNTLNGTILGDTPLAGHSAIQEMAKEPRFTRRYLAKLMIEVIENFPENLDPLVRHIRYIPSYYKNKAYIFLQLKVKGFDETYEEYREKRRKILEIACGAAKNKFNHLKEIIGIAIDAPKYSEGNSEDFILLNCEDWDEDLRKSYNELNQDWNFFNDESLTMNHEKVQEFPEIPKKREMSNRRKIGRNEKCPCGSGKKFKKCCIDIRQK